MRALIVQGKSPTTYWSYEHSLPFVRREAALPPLGAATLAALLPREWEPQIVDLNVEPLRDEALGRADAVLVSGMLAQAPSMRQVLARARRLGRRTVVGGPGPTTSPELFAEADHLFFGEAEGRTDLLVRALEGREADAPRILSPPGGERPDMRSAVVPRFDLLDLRRYASLSLQYSRGCPFQCEFCDIIEIYGRVPRMKSPEQVLAELDELLRLGGHGPLFFVDDNFIGNRRAVAKLLPHLSRWQREHGRPFDLYTEASVNLAAEPALVSAMVEAGFSAVFLGIETPSETSLTGAGKTQNLVLDQGEAVRRLTQAGLEVFAGFIVGFDGDGPDIFDRQIDFISSLPIPRAMVGLLTALPGTALWRRLEREDRLRGETSGDQFERPNFRTTLDDETLLRGYRRVLQELYSADNYYRRCQLHVDQVATPRGPQREGSLAALARAVVGIGLRGRRRRHFWSLVAHSLARGPAAAARAVSLAVMGEHLIRYTEEVVLPRLDRALAEIPRQREAAPAAAAPGTWNAEPGEPLPA
ncbi:MAG TPA: DUF4070 domain-containing protein [Anaeromyxobacteraceae bacterium]